MLWRRTASALAYVSASNDCVSDLARAGVPRAADGDHCGCGERGTLSVLAMEELLLRSDRERSRDIVDGSAGGDRETAASVAASQAVAKA